MDQVSLPLRIALAVVLAFAALWFVALRPKPVEGGVAEPARAPNASAAAPDERDTPAAATPRSVTKDPGANGERRTTSKATSAARGRGARAVLADLEAGRTVVLLVWDGKSADDRSVRRSVARLDRRGGKVRVHVAAISRLSAYEEITKGVPITESPTVLVIDRKHRARVISGLTVTAEIDDTVDRALRAR